MRKLFRVVSLFFFSAAVAFGQQLATLNVTVTDPSGSVVDNATVTLTDSSMGISRSCR